MRAMYPARALIHAAMDARRMGHGKALPVELLANAAPGYMSGDDPDLYGGSCWPAAALADVSRPLASGIEGPLTRSGRVRGTGADRNLTRNHPGNRRGARRTGPSLAGDIQQPRLRRGGLRRPRHAGRAARPDGFKTVT